MMTFWGNTIHTSLGCVRFTPSTAIMCGQCRAELKLALSTAVSGRKRPRQDPDEATAALAAPKLVPVRASDGSLVHATASVLMYACGNLHEMLDDEGALHVPLTSGSLAAVFIDFCQRVSNVKGRVASVRIAWRKSIWPTLLAHHNGLQSVVDMLSIARKLECGPLRQQCCATLAEPLVLRQHEAFLWALEPVACEELRLALVGDVMAYILNEGGGEAVLQRAVNDIDGASSSLEWLYDAARSALEQARDRMQHEREAEMQRVHLGLGVDVERDLNPSIDRDPSPPDVT